MKDKNFFKDHAGTILILAAIFLSMLWINGKFFKIEKELAVIKQFLL